MPPAKCLELLGLAESATIDQIKRAYRRRAHQLHPDKHGGDEQARQQFVAVSEAYRSLMRAARAIEDDRPIGVCAECGHFGEAIPGLDGRPRCPRCILRPEGGRMLPMPALIVARCIGSAGLIAIAAALLAAGIATDELASARHYAIAAGVAGLLSLVTLAHTSLKIVHCITAREQALQNRYRAAESQARSILNSRPKASRS